MATVIIDATNAVAGRLAAFVAKTALKGDSVQIYNSQKAVFTGKPVNLFEVYRKRRTQQNKANPDHSPHWPRRPDFFLKKVIKGMLPKHAPRGKAAEERITCFLTSVPEGKKALVFAKKIPAKSTSVQQICEKLGWTVNE